MGACNVVGAFIHKIDWSLSCDIYHWGDIWLAHLVAMW